MWRRPVFHWTDQKLRGHAFYSVLALVILNLLRRKPAQSGIVLSNVEMMTRLEILANSLSSIRSRSAPSNRSSRPSSPK